MANIDIGQIEDAGSCGIVLHDLFEHFARALHQSGKSDNEQSARFEILGMFAAENEHSTGIVEGGLTN